MEEEEDVKGLLDEQPLKLAIYDRLTETEHCVVCGDVADGYHYGVLSCRGCNAFFRRAVTFNMSFNCRRGGVCLVDKSARCACRSCRLRKCEEKGMDRRAVQPKRDSNGKYLRRKSTNEENGQGCSVIPSEPPRTCAPIGASPRFETIGSPDSAFTSPPPRRLTALTPDLPHTSSLPPLPHPSPNDETEQTFLSRMVVEYKQQRKRRRAMLCTSIEEILSEQCETALKAAATGDDYAAIFRVQMVLMFEWCEKLDEFRLIKNPYDKTRLLRAFALRYLLLDNLFYTIELGYYDRLVLVNNTFIIPGQVGTLLSIGDTEIERRVKTQMYGDHTFRVMDELSRPMLEMGISAGEMMALRLIIFWNPGSVGMSPEASTLIQKASDRAVRELHLWYDEQKLADVDMRLGNLLLLLPAFAKHAQNLFETVKLIPSFGVMYEWDSFMDDLLRL